MLSPQWTTTSNTQLKERKVVLASYPKSAPWTIRPQRGIGYSHMVFNVWVMLSSQRKEGNEEYSLASYTLGWLSFVLFSEDGWGALL